MDNTLSDKIFKFVNLAILVTGIVLHCILRFPISLWEDEIIAVTHATKPFLRVAYEALLTDMHPPLYFLELRLWCYFDQSDSWMIANSVILSLLAIVSIYYVIRRLSGAQEALLITAIYSVLPVTVWMAEEVRMYSFLSILFIWLYYFIYITFAHPKYSNRNYWVVFALSVAIVYTHAIGFIAIFLFGIYAASLLVTRHASRQYWLNWFFVFGGAAITAIPILLSSIVRKADMTPITNIGDIFSWMSSLVMGAGYEGHTWLYIVGLIIYLITIVFGTAFSQTRRLTLIFLIAPIVLCAVMELIAKPLFKTNFFPNLIAPFFAITIGNILLSLQFNKIIRLLILICICSLLAASAVGNRSVLTTASYYFKPASQIIEMQKRPGDIVWAPQPSAFWGIVWYLIGPTNESPLTVRESLRPESKWQKFLKWLGPELAKKWGLGLKSQSLVTKDGLPILIANENQPRAEQAKRIWLVTFARNDLPAGVPGTRIGSLHRTESFSFPLIELNLYER